MADDWKSIETAPRDGTRIRLGNDRTPRFWDKDPHGWGAVSGAWNGADWDLSAFFIVPGGRFGMLTSEATHWQPLPDREVIDHMAGQEVDA